MRYVQRDQGGAISGVFARPQPGVAEEVLADDAVELLAFLAGPEPTYRDERANAYRDQLGAEQGDFIKTIGDVLDTLIAQVEAMRAELGAARTADFAAMLTKIAAIKAEIPKP